MFTSVLGERLKKFLKELYILENPPSPPSQSIIRYPWVNFRDDKSQMQRTQSRGKHYWEKCHHFTRRESVNSQHSGEFLSHLLYTSEWLRLKQKENRKGVLIPFLFCYRQMPCLFKYVTKVYLPLIRPGEKDFHEKQRPDVINYNEV